MGKVPKTSPGGSKIGAKLPPRCLPGRPWEPLGPLRAPWLGEWINFDPRGGAPGALGGDPGEPWAPKWHPENAKMDARRRPRGSWETVGVRGGLRELFFHVLGKVFAIFFYMF